MSLGETDGDAIIDTIGSIIARAVSLAVFNRIGLVFVCNMKCACKSVDIYTISGGRATIETLRLNRVISEVKCGHYDSNLTPNCAPVQRIHGGRHSLDSAVCPSDAYMLVCWSKPSDMLKNISRLKI